MASIDKLKLRVISIPSDLKWGELVRFMKYYGYTVLSKGGGSHPKFYNKEKDILINTAKPHNPKVVRKHIIEQAITALKETGDL